jgi:hypothetical protein
MVTLKFHLVVAAVLKVARLEGRMAVPMAAPMEVQKVARLEVQKVARLEVPMVARTVVRLVVPMEAQMVAPMAALMVARTAVRLVVQTEVRLVVQMVAPMAVRLVAPMAVPMVARLVVPMEARLVVPMEARLVVPMEAQKEQEVRVNLQLESQFLGHLELPPPLNSLPQEFQEARQAVLKVGRMEVRKVLQPPILLEQLIEEGGLEKVSLELTTHRFELVQDLKTVHSMVQGAQFLEDFLVAKEGFLDPRRLLQV